MSTRIYGSVTWLERAHMAITLLQLRESLITTIYRKAILKLDKRGNLNVSGRGNLSFARFALF